MNHQRSGNSSRPFFASTSAAATAANINNNNNNTNSATTSTGCVTPSSNDNRSTGAFSNPYSTQDLMTDVDNMVDIDNQADRSSSLLVDDDDEDHPGTSAGDAGVGVGRRTTPAMIPGRRRNSISSSRLVGAAAAGISNSHNHNLGLTGAAASVNNHSSRFKRSIRGLSKSASQLLSQNNQTLTDLLNVEGVDNTGAGAVNLNNTNPNNNATAATTKKTIIMGKNKNHISSSSSPPPPTPPLVPLSEPVDLDLKPKAVHNSVDIIEQQQHHDEKEKPTISSNDECDTTSSYYLQCRIQELERQLKQKDQEWIDREKALQQSYEEKEALMRNEWERKLKEMEQTIADLQHNRTKSSLTDDGAVCPVPSISRIEKQKQLKKEIVAELSKDSIMRYSRQLLLNDGFGVEGQKKLLASSVLVVGAGGIGSSTLLYLAAAGIGNIEVVDFDAIDMGNLHRQVIHKDANVGINKAISACNAMRELNPTIKCTPIQKPITSENALELISKHNCVIDACDNPKTRYVVNDACILAKVPLVSGSAMGTEGQLTIYGYKGGGCYRCMYPRPNPTEGCKSCSDNGVLGPVPGLIGILEATEAIKVLTGIGETMHDKLLMYDSLRCSFMRIKKPPRRKDCLVCGSDATICNMGESKKSSKDARGFQTIISTENPFDTTVTNGLSSELNISCKTYNELRKQGDRFPHVLLDVRVERQFEMCSLEGSINMPLETLEKNLNVVEELSAGEKPIYCVCRRGIASVEATRILSKASSDKTNIHSVFNIVGGYNSWAEEIDSSFPKY